MTEADRKRIRLWLSSGAFLMVLMIAGCITSRTGARSSPKPEPGGSQLVDMTAQVEPSPQAALPAIQPAPEPAAPDINVFGEFNGIERTGVKLPGKAGFQQHTFASEGYDCDVSADPTGQWLVFASTRHSEQTDLYLQRIDGQSVTKLTDDAAEDAFPAVSPDGTRIAFCSTRAGSWDLYLMDTDGRGVVQVTSGPMQDIHPSFSPDGTRLVYSSMGSRSDQWELWTLDLLTHERRMIGFGLFPEWSSSKEVDRIAFQRARQRGSRWFSIWTLDLIDGEARRVTEVAVSANAALVAPTWSPDGKRIAFTSIVEPARMADGKPNGQQDVWVVDADGGNRQRITDGNGTNLSPHWAVDNRIYFISNRGGAECVWSGQAHTPGTATAANKDDTTVGSADAEALH